MKKTGKVILIILTLCMIAIISKIYLSYMACTMTSTATLVEQYEEDAPFPLNIKYDKRQVGIYVYKTNLHRFEIKLYSYNPNFNMTRYLNIKYDPTDISNFYYEDNTGKYNIWKSHESPILDW